MSQLLGRLAAAGMSAVLISGTASAEIQQLEDTQLSNITGQAGISIEIDNAELTIGEIRWHDADAVNVGGSVAVRDIRLAGADKTHFFGNQWIPNSARSDKLDNLKIDIDVLADGDFVAIMKPAGTFSVVDFGFSTGEWVLMDSTGADAGTKLFNSLDFTGIGIDARLRIDNQTAHTFIETTFGIDDLNADMDFLAIRIEGAQIAGVSYYETISLWGSSGAGIPDLGAEVDVELYTATNAQGNTALGFNLTKFQADIGLPTIYLGDKPTIGGLYFNNVNIVADTVIYGH